MKKTLITLSLFLCSFLSYSQVSLGAKGGVNYGSVSTQSDILENSPRVGFHAGLFAMINLPGKLGLQPEVMYSRQSYSAGEIEVGDGADNAMVVFENIANLDYVNVPILINYKVIPTLRIQLGPQFGFGISGKSKLRDVIGDSGAFEENFESDLDLNSAEIGIAAGIQFSLAKLIIQGRYTHGVTDVSPVLNGGRNRNFQLSLGYKFF